MKEILPGNSAISAEGDVLPIDDVFPGYSTPEPSIPEEDKWAEYMADYSVESSPASYEQGVAVRLDERLIALKAIARIYGKYNQADGFNWASQTPPMRHEIARRYKDPEAVADGMARKAAQLDEEMERHLAALTKDAELKAAGFDERSVNQSTVAVNREVNRDFGRDKKYPDRNKQLRKVQKTVRAVDKASQQ